MEWMRTIDVFINNRAQDAEYRLRLALVVRVR
jgi:hypothetical protein